MVPKRIHTRIFLNPNPQKVVENPERILRRSNTQADKGIFHLKKSLSFPAESVKSAESFSFDKGIDQSLSRFKFATELSQAFTSPERPNLFKPSQQPSHPSSNFVFPQFQNTQSVQNPITYFAAFVTPLVSVHIVVLPNPPIVMAARYDPLVFPT